MSDRDDSVLDRAEMMARRVLERLGARLDRKLHSDDKALSRQAVGDLAGRIENAIESNLQPDGKGLKRIAPNCIDVLLTYEETADVTDQYLEALSFELKVATQEYIHDRRYEVTAPIQFKLRRDLFTRAANINTTFDPHPDTATQQDPSRKPVAAAGQKQDKRTLHLAINGTGDHHLDLAPNEAPRSIGRAAGNALRIDDESVSRLHCSITLRTTGEVVVSDLGSANGTLINGGLLRTGDARAVVAGDVISVGDVQLSIKAIE